MPLCADGTWAAFAYKHILYLPIAVVQSGGFFGLFLACGTVIRCEETGAVIALRDATAAEQQARRARALDDDDAIWARSHALDMRPRNEVVAALTPPMPTARRSAMVAAIFADSD